MEVGRGGGDLNIVLALHLQMRTERRTIAWNASLKTVFLPEMLINFSIKYSDSSHNRIYLSLPARKHFGRQQLRP